MEPPPNLSLIRNCSPVTTSVTWSVGKLLTPAGGAVGAGVGAGVGRGVAVVVGLVGGGAVGGDSVGVGAVVCKARGSESVVFDVSDEDGGAEVSVVAEVDGSRANESELADRVGGVGGPSSGAFTTMLVCVTGSSTTLRVSRLVGKAESATAAESAAGVAIPATMPTSVISVPLQAETVNARANESPARRRQAVLLVGLGVVQECCMWVKCSFCPTAIVS